MIVAHLGDTHIFNESDRHDEYRDIFGKIYKELKKIKPDRIVLCGDLFESKLTLTNEAKVLAGEFLNNLANISKVKIIIGNHDLNIKNLSRVDSIDMIVKLINNPNIEYYNKSGIYEDDEIAWVVYNHPEKNVDPWLNQVKDDDKIYIGLFHDPIQNCTTDVGKVFNDKKLKDINYFKNNDYLMLADIHKRQYFRKNKSAAYCGSTIQKDFGENIAGHGFLVWNIESPTEFTVDEYDIFNDHAFVNLTINEGVDYDNLSLNSPIFKEMEVKVHWTDYSSNINIINEKKIRDYIKTNFNTTKVKFEKVYLYNDIISSKMLTESLDLSDLQVQTKIFKEYLEEQKYKQEDIKEILKIDEIINSRLHLADTIKNIEWSVDKFWFSNFKSYGDDNEVDWKDVDGIYQIFGVNKMGKTTIIDALTYILYGKTTTTLNQAKFGDNRYINNKRFLDYCLGGAVIDVNGEKFIIQRKTERVWNKNKTALTSCPTTLDFYSSETISEENKLTGEVKNKTQKKLDSILSEFLDFIRLSYTNADNLNNILSETRAVFIDNVIRDAGMDIFETKVEEFKEYKKELSEEKLVVNIQESESEVEKLKDDIIVLNSTIQSNLEEIENFEKSLKNNNDERDNLNKKLNNIDSSMINFDEDINLESIENYKLKIEECKIQKAILDRDIEKLPSSFDATKLNNLKISLKKTTDKISARKEEISAFRNTLTESDNKIDKINVKINELKSNEIKRITAKISDNDLKIQVIQSEKEKVVNDEIKNITSEIQKVELKKGEKTSEIKLLQKDGAFYKKNNEDIDVEIKELKESTSCPSCGRAFDKNDPKYSEHIEHIQEKIKSLELKKSENDDKIKSLMSEYVKMKSTLNEFETSELTLKQSKDDLKNGIFTEIISQKLKEIGSNKVLKEENKNLKDLIEEIENDNYDNSITLKENISKGLVLIENIEKSKIETLQVIKNIVSELKNYNIENIENDIEIEERKKDNFELRKQKISNKDNIDLTVENYNFKIKELKLEIDKYQEYKVKIEENKTLQLSIDELDKNILDIKDDIKKMTDSNNDLEKDILLIEKNIEDINSKIKRFLKQKKKDELLKEYSKCIGRDGIPSYLLKKSIHLINHELTELLSNVDFTLYFDEELELKMSMDDRMDVSQPAITSSGMERTFCALALKIALRQINVKSKSNVIFLDECTGKLIGESVQQFMDFLEILKTKVKKVVIIEHNHSINYDSIINVKKDANLVSSLELR
jgi:DNA repair exonuclease SbcCD ATPase subunit/DNA repair exonuclease SbcCD nuclease subunit